MDIRPNVLSDTERLSMVPGHWMKMVCNRVRQNAVMGGSRNEPNLQKKTPIGVIVHKCCLVYVCTMYLVTAKTAATGSIKSIFKVMMRVKG